MCAVDLRSQLTTPLPADFMNNSASVVPAYASFANVAEGAIVGDLWTVAQQSQEAMLKGIAEGEAFRLNDITKRGAFAEMGPIFAIPCLWSNCGRLEAPGAETVEAHL